MDLLLDMCFSLAAQWARSKQRSEEKKHRDLISQLLSVIQPPSKRGAHTCWYCIAVEELKSVCTPVCKQIESRITEVVA